MSTSASTNFTGGNAFDRAGADGDMFDRDHVNKVAAALDNHNHADALGLGVKRLQTSAAPTASGEVGVVSNVLQWWNGSAAASAMTNPMTTTGDTIYGGASGTPTRLVIGVTNDVLSIVGGVPVWRYPTLTTSTSHLAADTSALSANTFTDTVSVSLTAGTWLVMAHFTANVAAGANYTARLHDGTNNLDSAQLTMSAADEEVTFSVFWIVTPASTLTHKLQVACDQTAIVRAAAPNNPAGNTATGIIAVRIG